MIYRVLKILINKQKMEYILTLIILFVILILILICILNFKTNKLNIKTKKLQELLLNTYKFQLTEKIYIFDDSNPSNLIEWKVASISTDFVDYYIRYYSKDLDNKGNSYWFAIANMKHCFKTKKEWLRFIEKYSKKLIEKHKKLNELNK